MEVISKKLRELDKYAYFLQNNDLKFFQKQLVYSTSSNKQAKFQFKHLQSRQKKITTFRGLARKKIINFQSLTPDHDRQKDRTLEPEKIRHIPEFKRIKNMKLPNTADQAPNNTEAGCISSISGQGVSVVSASPAVRRKSNICPLKKIKSIRIPVQNPEF